VDELEFEWDPSKARSNLRKHGVGFVEAMTVFGDRFGRMRPDRADKFEQRSVMVGLSAMGRLLVVAFADRGRIRIISARRATPFERHVYEETAG
jgi:hypothetical protein